MRHRGRRGDRWLRCHIGRRGAFLAFLAILDGCYAWALADPLPGAPGYGPLWVALWAAGGLSALSGVAIRHDKIQYGFAAGLKAVWAGDQMRRWLDGIQPRGWVSAVVWVTFAVIVLLTASWPEAAPPRAAGPPDSV